VIHGARISTQGDRARDAFTITDPAGQKIDADEAALISAFTESYMRG
jgi:UTP:GlnB (protein PII) uridylyltransferase